MTSEWEGAGTMEWLGMLHNGLAEDSGQSATLSLPPQMWWLEPGWRMGRDASL